MTHWHCLLWFTTAACVSAIATAATHDSAATATHDVSKACIHVDERAVPARFGLCWLEKLDIVARTRRFSTSREEPCLEL